VPIAGETLEPRDRKVNSSELRYASAFNFPVNSSSVVPGA